MIRLVRTVVTTLVAVTVSVLLTAGGAQAKTLGDDPCVNDPTATCQPSPASESDLLPVNRWSEATGQFHARLGDMPWDDTMAKIQRGATYPALITLGNSMWSGATGMVSAAVRMDILDSAGQTADNAAASIGDSLVSSGLLALMAVIALMVPAWRAARGQGQGVWGAAAKTSATVALFVVMLSGAHASTTDAAGTFQPGFMSPGWFVTTTNSVLSSLASAPAAALVSKSSVGAGYTYAESSTGDLSCSQYVDRLKADYLASNPATWMQNSLPLVMSGMWEATGLKVWSVSQFGANNPYGDFEYCRMLEQFAGTSPAEQRSITMRASNNPNVAASNVYSLAWAYSQDVQLDRSMVAWAQCRPGADKGSWNLAAGWEKADGHDTAPSDCNSWWTMAARFNDSHGDWFGDGQSVFDWDGTDHINSGSGDLQVKNYLLTLQGKTSGATASLAMVYAYVLSALIMLVVFGMVAISIIVAKVSALVMMLMTFLALLISLWPGNAGKQGSIGKYFGQFVGMSMLVFGVQLIFAFLTLLTSILVKAGTDMFGDGAAVISMAWTGFAPVVAVIVLHQVFKKVLKMPSPFSVTGASQWGQAAAGGAVGAAAGGALMSRVNRLGRHGEQALITGARRAGGHALSTVSGGRFGRPGRGRDRSGALAVNPVDAGGGGHTTGTGKTNTRRGARNVWGAATAPEREGTAAERRQQRLAERDAANAAALERGRKNTVVGRYKEGLRATWGWTAIKGKVGKEQLGERWGAVREELVAHPIKTPLRGAGKAAKAGLKVAGAGALVVGTGGLAAPAMAAVWGTRRARGHLGNVRAGQQRAAQLWEAGAEIRELEAAKAAERERQWPTGAPAGAGAAHVRASMTVTRTDRRQNGRTITVPSDNPVAAQDPPRQVSPVRIPQAAAAGTGPSVPQRTQRRGETRFR